MTRTRGEDQLLDKISELIQERDYWRRLAELYEEKLDAHAE